MSSSFGWLHLSDLHLTSRDNYDRHTILNKLVDAVTVFRQRGRPVDVIFVTGDIVSQGQTSAYANASIFFERLLAAAELPRERLLVVPGNHDVDRDRGEFMARTLASRDQSDKYFHQAGTHDHFQKLSGFQAWHDKFFEGIRTFPMHSTCAVDVLDLNGIRVRVARINSALFCSGIDDHGKLWVGRRCLDILDEHPRCDLSFALMHHPLDWLHEEDNEVEERLHSHMHFILRGHLHSTRLHDVATPSGTALRLAAGASYQSGKWPKLAMFGRVDGANACILPIRYYDDNAPVWREDPGVFPNEPSHEKCYRLTPINSEGPRSAVQGTNFSNGSTGSSGLLILEAEPAIVVANGSGRATTPKSNHERPRGTRGWLDLLSEVVALALFVVTVIVLSVEVTVVNWKVLFLGGTGVLLYLAKSILLALKGASAETLCFGALILVGLGLSIMAFFVEAGKQAAAGVVAGVAFGLAGGIKLRSTLLQNTSSYR